MEIIIQNSVVLERVDNDLFTGWAPSTSYKVITGTPKFTWKGAKIPFALWSQIVCFMRWSQEKYKEETMITLFYNLEKKEWAAWAFPQEPAGMSIKLLPDHPLYEEDRKLFGTGWLQAGSVHHHCTAGAFQSGTDTTDEKDRDGVHITLGKMDQNIIDTHIRQVFDGVQGDSALMDWIDIPEYTKGIPQYLRYDFAMFCLKAVRNEEFPEIWANRIFKREVVAMSNITNPHTGGHSVNGWTSPMPGSSLITRGMLPTSSKDGHGANSRKLKPRLSAGHITDWEKKTAEKLKTIIDEMGITAVDAYVLMNNNNVGMNAEEVVIRQELQRRVIVSGTPALYAESLFQRMF